MSDTDIALSFDTAEYYSLQEACDYLNRKYKVDNITPKKLLKQISNRNINSFIHFRIDNLDNKRLRLQIDSYNSNIIPTDKSIYELEEVELKPIVEILNRLEDSISSHIVDELYMGQILLRVNQESLFNMSLNTESEYKTFIFSFDGFVHKSNYNNNPNTPEQLTQWSVKSEDKEYYLTEIGHLYFIIDSTDDKDLKDFESKIPYSCSFEKRKNYAYAHLEISVKNLIVFHNDLSSLEEEIKKNKPIGEQSEFKPRKGVSQKKILAKEFAKHIAQEQWIQDTENKIKIGEMCNIVWAKLLESSFHKELPNHIENLRPWIKEVAPPYASEAGRPQL